jgi:hypothetical protein
MTLGELRDALCNTNHISHKSTTTHPQNLCALRVLCARQRRCYHLHALLRRLHRRSRAHAMTLGELRDTLCNTNHISHKSTTTHPQKHLGPPYSLCETTTMLSSACITTEIAQTLARPCNDAGRCRSATYTNLLYSSHTAHHSNVLHENAKLLLKKDTRL